MAECERHRDPMASVEDVVAVRSLDEIDGREGPTDPVGERDPLPARAHEFRGGAEAGVEVNGGFERPDDAVERNNLDVAGRFQPACAIVHRRRMPEPSLSREPAGGASNGMRSPGAAEIGLCVERWHSGGIGGQRPEHFASHDRRGRAGRHRASAYAHPLDLPCFSLVPRRECEVPAEGSRKPAEARSWPPIRPSG
jgi:hypothetical protein